MIANGDPHQLAVLRYGIRQNDEGVRYCDDAVRELGAVREESA